MNPTRMLAPLALAALPLMMAACASPETRVRTGLIRAGLPADTAQCVAGRMVDRLSLSQLSRLGDIPKARTAPTRDEFLHNIRSLGDAEVVGVVTSSTALCGTGLAR